MQGDEPRPALLPTGNDMSNETLTIFSLLVSSIGTILVGVSAILLWRQIRETHDWNRRKTSQEILGSLTLGEFPALREKVEIEFDCQIWNRQETYATKSAGLTDQDKQRLAYAVIRVLNALETISIHMKNHIVDEDICYDYLGWILIQYVRWSGPLIDDRRRKAGDLRIYKVVSDFAEKWEQRFNREQKIMADGAAVQGRTRL